MEITREEARKIFMAGAMWEQKATDYNFEDLWKNIQPKLKSMESGEGESFTKDDMRNFSNYMRNGISNLEYCAKSEIEHFLYWQENYRYS